VTRFGVGHIISTGADKTFCNREKSEIKLNDGKFVYSSKWRPEEELCEECQRVMRTILAAEYGLPDWGREGERVQA